MIKKLIKNILLTFAIVFSIFSIIELITLEITTRNAVYDLMEKLSPENRTMEMYEELEMVANSQVEGMALIFNEDECDVPVPKTYLAMVQDLTIGMINVIEIQSFVLIYSACIGIAIGIIISLEEKSKIKQILIFILLGVVFCTIGAFRWGIMFDQNFLEIFIEEFVYTFKNYIFYYLVIYILAFIARYFIIKKKANKLNEELNSKQKLM